LKIIFDVTFREKFLVILGVVKRNPLFLHEIEWKNNKNGFLFTTPNKNRRLIRDSGVSAKLTNTIY